MISKELADSLAGLLFPRKLWTLANAKEVESIKWGKQGTTVQIDSVMVEKECFKPNVFNVQSNQHVLRQMSYYNFQKIDRKCKVWEFKHEHFQAGREDLIHLVKRQPQGLPKKYMDDIERRYSSRLQKQSRKGERPDYARMEKGPVVDSDGESDGSLTPRGSIKKRPYNRRNPSLEVVKLEEGERPIRGSSRGRGSRRGGRGRKRMRQEYDEKTQEDGSSYPAEEDSNTDNLVMDFDQTRSGMLGEKELEYIVPNTESWLYGSLEDRLDGLTIAGDVNRADGSGKLPLDIDATVDDKSQLRQVIESTERAMYAKKLEQANYSNDWYSQSQFGMQQNWNSPSAYVPLDVRYNSTPEIIDVEMYNNRSYPMLNQVSTASGNQYVTYDIPSFPKDENFDASYQYGSVGNVSYPKVHPSCETMTSQSEFAGYEGKQDNVIRLIDAADEIYQPSNSQTNRIQDNQKSFQDNIYDYDILKDFVSLDHNYNAFKNTEFCPMDKTIQSVMQQQDSLLLQLLEEENTDGNMNEFCNQNSGDPLELPQANYSTQFNDSDKTSEEPNSAFDSTQKSSEEQNVNSFSSSNGSFASYIHQNASQLTSQNSDGDEMQLTIPGENFTGLDGRHGDTSFNDYNSDAKEVAYFLLDSTKYKRYSFTVSESGDIVIKNGAEDFQYWRTNKDVNPQTLIASPCLDVNL